MSDLGYRILKWCYFNHAYNRPTFATISSEDIGFDHAMLLHEVKELKMQGYLKSYKNLGDFISVNLTEKAMDYCRKRFD